LNPRKLDLYRLWNRHNPRTIKHAATTPAAFLATTTASAGDACLAHVNAIRKQHGSPPYKILDTAHQKCTAAEAKADAKSGKAHGSFTKCGEHGQRGWWGIVH
jgi:hypothetical protein